MMVAGGRVRRQWPLALVSLALLLGLCGAGGAAYVTGPGDAARPDAPVVSTVGDSGHQVVATQALPRLSDVRRLGKAPLTAAPGVLVSALVLALSGGHWAGLRRSRAGFTGIGRPARGSRAPPRPSRPA
jgi:hypothetical protein